MGKLFTHDPFYNRVHVFQNRTEAGKHLASMLAGYPERETLVLAIPAGGVPVACEIARQLALPLELLIVRKIQLPYTTEAGFGAVGPDGEVIFNEALRSKLRKKEVEQQVQKTRDEVRERERLLRGERPFPDVKEKDLVLVDDGLASGYTMAEAVRFLQKKGAGRIVVAVPTAPQSTVDFLLPQVDELYCPNIRSRYPFAVADAYRHWYDLSTTEVLECLREYGHR